MSDVSAKMKQVSALKNGTGVQHLLNCGYRILGNPLYIHDVDYRLIAHTENVATDDFLLNELITRGIHSQESIELFKNEEFIDAVANAGTIALLSSDKIKYDRILGKVQNKKNITVACMDVVACNKPFDIGDALVFEALCDVMSKEISENDFYQIYGEQYQEKIIWDLVDGNIRDMRLYTRRVGSIYEGLKNTIRIAAVDISKNNLGFAYLTYYKNLLREAESTYKYALYENYIIIVMSSDNPSFNAGKGMYKLSRIFERNNMYMGISSGFENLFIAKRYFTEAVDALYSGLRQNANRRIHMYG